MRKTLTAIGLALLLAGSASANHKGLAIQNPSVFEGVPRKVERHIWDIRHEPIEPKRMGRGAQGTFYSAMWVGDTYLEGVFTPNGEHVVIEAVTAVIRIAENGKIEVLWSTEHA